MLKLGISSAVCKLEVIEVIICTGLLMASFSTVSKIIFPGLQILMTSRCSSSGGGGMAIWIARYILDTSDLC